MKAGLRPNGCILYPLSRWLKKTVQKHALANALNECVNVHQSQPMFQSLTFVPAPAEHVFKFRHIPNAKIVAEQTYIGDYAVTHIHMHVKHTARGLCAALKGVIG